MRLFSTTILALLIFGHTEAQNVGVGITTPRAKFHVFNGASGNTLPFGPMVVESNAQTYISLLSPEANETGILFGKPSNAASGGIIYNGLNTPNGFEFRNNGNNPRVIITNNGRVGIGTYIPAAPLGFNTDMGKKITLFTSSASDYGFGIQPGLLQVYTDQPSSDIAFGYDQGGGVLAEKFRFKGNGTFVVNGSAGNAGQVLQTNGNAASPTWTTPTNLLYNNTALISNLISTVINTSTQKDIPFSYTFTTSTNAKVIVIFCFHVYAPSCFACGDTGVRLYINLNGSLARQLRVDFPNDKQELFSGNALVSVGPGTHTISFSAGRDGPDIDIGYGGYTSHVIFQIIPQ